MFNFVQINFCQNFYEENANSDYLLFTIKSHLTNYKHKQFKYANFRANFLMTYKQTVTVKTLCLSVSGENYWTEILKHTMIFRVDRVQYKLFLKRI